ESIDRVIAGPERKSRVVSDREKEITAYHEAGHALIGFLLPDADPVAKISIISRGAMGGYTRFSPEEDRNLVSKKQLEAQLAVALGGRTAEELIFNEITTGASNDLEQATNIARNMVTRLGMSKKLGPRTFGKREELVFLGRDLHEQRDYSNQIAEEIDGEVHELIEAAHKIATEQLTANRETLDKIAKYLLEYETIEEDQIEEVFGPRPPRVNGAAAPSDN
ncbi:MAG: cell division protein FtsH, partial [Chloroflexi bacterium]|nr:cell division protein FtsH [Chloroflexota bacterium]